MPSLPHRRADPADCWSHLLFGELVRLAQRPVVVREDRTIRLPRSGRWQQGLARLRPGLDDALGSTALAIAWRWACAETEARGWPSLQLIAERATDSGVRAAPMAELARFAGGGRIVDGPGEVTWELGALARLGITGLAADWREVDRIAAIAAAWLDQPWRRIGPHREATNAG